MGGNGTASSDGAVRWVGQSVAGLTVLSWSMLWFCAFASSSSPRCIGFMRKPAAVSSSMCPVTLPSGELPAPSPLSCAAAA